MHSTSIITNKNNNKKYRLCIYLYRKRAVLAYKNCTTNEDAPLSTSIDISFCSVLLLVLYPQPNMSPPHCFRPPNEDYELLIEGKMDTYVFFSGGKGKIQLLKDYEAFVRCFLIRKKKEEALYANLLTCVYSASATLVLFVRGRLLMFTSSVLI